jgi:hypothetical protein
MFMLYSIAIGIALGLLLGGKLGHLAGLRLAWVPLAILALFVQTILFTETVWFAIVEWVPYIYVASMVVILAVVIRNVPRLPLLGLVAAGTASNLAAIVANGGYMPVTAEALGVAQPEETLYGGNSILTAEPVLPLLADRFAMPEWMPLATAFSIGDVLIALGLIAAVVTAMRAEPAVAVGPGEPSAARAPRPTASRVS